MIKGPKEALRKRIDELHAALDDVQDSAPENEEDGDLIDRSGYQQGGQFTLSHYTESFYENMEDVMQSLDAHRADALSDPRMHYLDAYERICLSAENLYLKMLECEMDLTLSDDDNINIYMLMDDLLKRHFAPLFLKVNMNMFTNMAHVFPHIAHLPLKHPENIGTENILTALCNDNLYYNQVYKNIPKQENKGAYATYLSEHKRHLFYFDPAHKTNERFVKDMRYTGCAVRESRSDKKDMVTQAVYYTPIWKGYTESALSNAFVEASKRKWPVQLPSGRSVKYVQSPEYHEQRDWLLNFYDETNTVFELPYGIKKEPLSDVYKPCF